MAAKNKEAMPSFSKAINDVSHRYDLQQIFDDFLRMAVCCFALGKMEQQYHEIIRRYDQGELNRFSLALAAMINEYEEKSQDGDWCDVLGTFFEEVNSASTAQRSGQFFTPKVVCDLMAMMLEGDEKDDIKVIDPTCGSGRNLIAANRLDPRNRHRHFYVAQDLDSRCVNMTVLNYVMYGMRGIVVHMDTLAMNIFSGFRIYLPETGLGVVPLNEQQCWSFLTEKKNKELGPEHKEDVETMSTETKSIPEVSKSALDSFSLNL